MAVDTASAPSWLFSFVDLAFLLLIAMTQIADPNAPELGEIVVPRIEEEATRDLPSKAAEAWQLRVYPREEAAGPPFELRRVGGPMDGQPGIPMTLDELQDRLAVLHNRGEGKPLLAPHAESRSQDLLDAVAAIEDRWPNRRRATVGRLRPAS